MKIDKKFQDFTTCKTLKDIKSIYKKYAMVFHPDLGGNLEDMQRLNNLYEYLFNNFVENLDHETKEYETVSREIPKDFINDIMNIIFIDNIDIDIIGFWIWIDTKKVSKENYMYLKSCGFEWSKHRKKLFKDTSNYVNKETKIRYYHTKKSYDDLKNAYGYQKVDTDEIKNTKKLF